MTARDGNMIAGHGQIIELIKSIVSGENRSHSYLFYGPAHVGKSKCARLLAMSLNCRSLSGGLACFKCDNCRKIMNNTFPFLTKLNYKFGEIPIDDIRTRIIGPSMLKVPDGVKHVYIINDVRFFNPESANCFLKTLEEPGANIIFILVTSSLNSLLPTIRSRCQLVKFSHVGESETADYIKKISPAVEGNALRFVVSVNENIGQAVSCVLGDGFEEDYPRVVNQAEEFLKKPGSGPVSILMEMAYPSDCVPDIDEKENNLHLDELFDKIDVKILSVNYIRVCFLYMLLILIKRSARRDALALIYQLSKILEQYFDNYKNTIEEHIAVFKKSMGNKIINDLIAVSQKEAMRLKRDEYGKIMAVLCGALQKAYTYKKTSAALEGNEFIHEKMLREISRLYDAEEIEFCVDNIISGYYRDISANINLDFYLENYILMLLDRTRKKNAGK